MLIKLFITTILLYQVESARILAVVPTPSFSHQVFYRPLWQELAKRGHDLVLITTDPMRLKNSTTSKNLREIDVSIAYECKNNPKLLDIGEVDVKTGFILTMEFYLDSTRLVFSHKEVKELFKDKSQHFDLLMIECMFPAVNIFKYRFNIPTVCLTSLDAWHSLHEMMGNPTHHINYPNSVLPFGEGMNFIERLISVAFLEGLNLYFGMSMIPQVDKILKQALDEELPSITEQMGKFDMLFTNANPAFNSIRPFTPATINLAGGLHETPINPLPKDLKDFLDNAKEGVIYFSLGSNVKSNIIKPETRKVIMDTFRELPYKVLWKFEDDIMPNKPDNVKIAKWVPQQDVLRHKNIKVFVTQAGLQSLEEALYAKIPMVALPFFGDQGANAKSITRKGLGLDLDHKTLTVENFKIALVEVINNDKYKKRITEIADLIKDQPMKPLETAVWWTEYILRHKGAQHLKGPRIPIWQFYYFDVLGFILLVFGILAFVLFKLVKISFWVVCKILGCGKSKENKNQRKSKRE